VIPSSPATSILRAMVHHKPVCIPGKPCSSRHPRRAALIQLRGGSTEKNDLRADQAVANFTTL
jgi:hypothetical protein